MASENSLKEIANAIMNIYQRTGKIPQDMTACLLKGLNELRETKPKAANRVKKHYEKMIAAQPQKKTQKRPPPKKPRRRI